MKRSRSIGVLEGRDAVCGRLAIVIARVCWRAEVPPLHLAELQIRLHAGRRHYVGHIKIDLPPVRQTRGREIRLQSRRVHEAWAAARITLRDARGRRWVAISQFRAEGNRRLDAVAIERRIETLAPVAGG